MRRFWVSWYSGYYADEGCTKPPFRVWITGQAERHNYGLTNKKYATYCKIQDEDRADAYLDKHGKDTATICAIIDAENEEEIWPVIAKHFPDYKFRFCEERAIDWVVGDRF